MGREVVVELEGRVYSTRVEHDDSCSIGRHGKLREEIGTDWEICFAEMFF